MRYLRSFLHAWGNGGRWKIMGTALVVSLLWASGVVVVHYRQVALPDPLGDYPVQTVEEPHEPFGLSFTSTVDKAARVSLPTVHYDGKSIPSIHVTAIKCSSARVKIRGNSVWRSIEPPGSLFPNPSVSAERRQGCVTFMFNNPLDGRVLERVRDLHAQGIDESSWQLQGTEVPIVDDIEGRSKDWQTENFAIRWTP